MARRCSGSSMSMKSMTMIPPRSRNRKLTNDLHRGLEVDLEHRLLERLRTDELAGVDIDRHQGLGLVDDQVAAGSQPHLWAQDFFQLTVDPE